MTFTFKSRSLGHAPGGEVIPRFSTIGFSRGPSKGILESLNTTTSPGPPFIQENDFYHSIERHKPLRASGPGLNFIWDSFPNSENTNYRPSSWTSYVTPDYTELTNEALKHANPNTPIVDVPLFLFELKDLPELIKQLGVSIGNSRGSRRAIDDPTSSYLSYTFGVAPLLNDLRTLLDLSDQIDSEIEKLRKRNKAKQVRGSLPSRSDALVDLTAKNHSYSNTYIWYREHYSFVERSWFTANYRVDLDSLLSVDSGKKERLRWALGLDASLSTIWNAIPWTWLTDYFVTVGDYLDANRGGIPWKASDMCIMTEAVFERRDVVTSTNGWSNDSYSIEEGSSKAVIQRRKVVPYPFAKVNWFPFLTQKMEANIAALAASYATGDSGAIRLSKR